MIRKLGGVVLGLFVSALPVAAQADLGATRGRNPVTGEPIPTSPNQAKFDVPAENVAWYQLALKYDKQPEWEAARLEKYRGRLNSQGAMVTRMFNVVASWSRVAANLMPENEYTFRPTPDVRSFGEILLHVTGSMYGFCGQGINGTTDEMPAFLKPIKHTEKDKIVKALDNAIKYCKDALDSHDEEWLTHDIITTQGPTSGEVPGDRAASFMYAAMHTQLLYGNMVTYMRMKDHIPPSTVLSHDPRTWRESKMPRRQASQQDR